MNFYNCTVRLGGDTAHEVNKAGLTAPEIMVLRRIHGLDAVVRIAPALTIQKARSNREERDHLRHIYCSTEGCQDYVNELFGPDHIPLPTTLDADEEVVAEQAARDRELKDTNTTTVTQEQLDALIAKGVAMATKLAEMPSNPPAAPGGGAEMPVDPNAPDPETGKMPDHVIAEWEVKREAGLKKKWAEG